MPNYPLPPQDILERIRLGLMIPAHPLALNKFRKLDERRQKVLTRYYLEAGCGGLAIGVHTTQFAIHKPEVGLYRPVLELAASTISQHNKKLKNTVVAIAGICGKTRQATAEARLARELGYHAGLLSPAAFRKESESQLLDHCQKVAEIIPLFGFYLQPAVGGRVLSYVFWRKFLEIPNVVGIKIAPFNRYQTVDVVRALADSGRHREICLYTGNDDHIVLDLLTTYQFGKIKIQIKGGLLGHWAFWTKKAVAIFNRIRKIRESGQKIPQEMLTLAAAITDCNSAVFDATHNFAGCLPGIHQILYQQGLLTNIYCLDPRETLSPGQKEEIVRVYHLYRHLADDDFVRENLSRWLS